MNHNLNYPSMHIGNAYLQLFSKCIHTKIIIYANGMSAHTDRYEHYRKCTPAMPITINRSHWYFMIYYSMEMNNVITNAWIFLKTWQKDESFMPSTSLRTYHQWCCYVKSHFALYIVVTLCFIRYFKITKTKDRCLISFISNH